MKSFERIGEDLEAADEKLRGIDPDELDEKLIASVLDQVMDSLKELNSRVSLLAERVDLISGKLNVEGE